MSKRSASGAAPKKCVTKKNKPNPDCVICFEQGNVPCRDGTGCTAKMCWKCIGELWKTDARLLYGEVPCPVCRRLFFAPNFTKLYEGARSNPNALCFWRFSYNGVQAEVRMLHDQKIQGQAIVLGQCPSNVSHKAKDIEKLEEYAADVGVIASEIGDDDSISLCYTEFDGEAEVLGETEPFKHITKQLKNMGMGYSRVAGIFDYIRLSGKDFKRFLKEGRFY